MLEWTPNGNVKSRAKAARLRMVAGEETRVETRVAAKARAVVAANAVLPVWTQSVSVKLPAKAAVLPMKAAMRMSLLPKKRAKPDEKVVKRAKVAEAAKAVRVSKVEIPAVEPASSMLKLAGKATKIRN